MQRTIMICNQKGGVGKTTTTLEMAGLLTKKGYNVLTIDTDSQMNLTMYSDVYTDGVKTIRDMLIAASEGDIGNPSEYICHAEEGYDIIIGDSRLAKAAVDFGKLTDMCLMQDVIESLDTYDYILIDCAPGRNEVMYMSYLAADYCIIISESDNGSLKGINEIHKDISLLKKKNLSNISILGLLLTKDESTKEQMAAYQKMVNIGAEINAMPFETTIWKSIAATESKNKCITISKYYEQGNKEEKKKSKAIKEAYEDFIEEVEERIRIFEGVE